MASISLLHIIGLINPKHWFLSLMGMENIFLIATMSYAENWLQRESWLLAMIIQDMEELEVMEFQDLTKTFLTKYNKVALSILYQVPGPV